MGWTQDKGQSMTREQGEWCSKTYEDAVVSMNAHFQCVLPVNDGLAAWGFGARVLPPSAPLIPANALRALNEAIGEGLTRDLSVADANGVFDK